MLFTIKQHDTKKPLSVQLYDDEAGNADLTDCTVTFRMGQPGAVLLEATATIQDAQNGVVWYVFNDGETATPGLYQGEFEVNYPDFRKETFPADGYITIEIKKSLKE